MYFGPGWRLFLSVYPWFIFFPSFYWNLFLTKFHVSLKIYYYAIINLPFSQVRRTIVLEIYDKNIVKVYFGPGWRLIFSDWLLLFFKIILLEFVFFTKFHVGLKIHNYPIKPFFVWLFVIFLKYAEQLFRKSTINISSKCILAQGGDWFFQIVPYFFFPHFIEICFSQRCTLTGIYRWNKLVVPPVEAARGTGSEIRVASGSRAIRWNGNVVAAEEEASGGWVWMAREDESEKKIFFKGLEKKKRKKIEEGETNRRCKGRESKKQKSEKRAK